MDPAFGGEKSDEEKQDVLKMSAKAVGSEDSLKDTAAKDEKRREASPLGRA